MHFKNFAYSLVATAPSPAASGTSLIVTASDGVLFPTPPFYTTVWPDGLRPSVTNAEIVLVTGVSGDTFTIVREQENTTARTVIVGDRIAATVTAEVVRRGTDCLFTQTATGTVANTSSESNLNNTGVGSLTLPAGFFIAGKGIRITARGYRSTTNPSGTLRIKVKLGSTVILDTTALTATNGLTNRAWELSGALYCRTVGASGTVFGQGRVSMSQAAATAAVFWEMLNTSAIVINTTISQAITVTAQWGTAHASNTMSCTGMIVEELN